MSELAKQMKARGIRNPWNLTEFDQWVNDATRKDIENIAEKHNFEVFGLELWEWKKIRGKNLVGALNFSVDLIFKNEDEPKVDALIREYRIFMAPRPILKVSQHSKKLVDNLFDLSVMPCTWV